MARNKSRRNYTKKPGFKKKSKGGMPTKAPASAATLESVMAPSVSSAPLEEATAQQIGLLQALIEQRRGMGIQTSELENYVLGLDDGKGVRSVVEDYIKQNKDKFDQTDPAGAAAYELMEEAVTLSEASLKASREEAKMIYARLSFLRELAKKTQGKQSAIADQLQQVISPVEKQLKKRISFGEFVKEQAQEFKKTLPERIVSRIPVVGGFLGQYLKQKRETQEDIEKYSGRLQETISRRGRTTGGLDISGGMRGSVSSGSIGGTRASDIPGIMTSGGGQRTLGGIHSEVVKIRLMLKKQFSGPGSDSTELRSREAELEALNRGKGISALGGKSGGAAEAAAGSGGWMSTIGSFISDTASNLIGSALGGKMMKLGGRAVSSLGRAGGSLIRGAGNLAGKAWGGLTRMGGSAMNFLKTTSLYKDTASIGKMATDAGKSAWSGMKSVGSKALDVVKPIGTKALDVAKNVGSTVSSAASSGGGWLKGAWDWTKSAASSAASKLNPLSTIKDGIKSGAGKIIKGIATIPGLGAIITSIMGAIDIAGIKSDETLTADEKKEQIGRRLVGIVGEALGGIGGGALGTFIPIPGLGTLIGTLGGSWVGGKLAELLADAVGGRGIYDMVASIPGVGSLIEVGGAEDQKAKGEGAEAVDAAATQTGQVGDQTTATSAEVTGTISAPATPNTTMGRMMNQYSVEQDALTDAQRGASSPQGTSVANNTSVKTNVSNTTNNFNDDLRIRNNEPTIKTMQMASHSW